MCLKGVGRGSEEGLVRMKGTKSTLVLQHNISGRAKLAQVQARHREETTDVYTPQIYRGSRVRGFQDVPA